MALVQVGLSLVKAGLAMVKIRLESEEIGLVWCRLGFSPGWEGFGTVCTQGKNTHCCTIFSNVVCSIGVQQWVGALKVCCNIRITFFVVLLGNIGKVSAT